MLPLHTFTTAVCTPPKRLYSLHWSPRCGLPSAILTVLCRQTDSIARPGGRRPLWHLPLLSWFLRGGHRNLFLFFLFLSGHQLPFPILLWGLASGGCSIGGRYISFPFLGNTILKGRRRKSLLPFWQLFWGTSQRRRARSPKDTHPFRGSRRSTQVLFPHRFFVSIHESFFQRIVRRGTGRNSWERVCPWTEVLPQFPEAQPPLSRSRKTRTDRTRSKQHRLRHLCSIRTT